MRKGHIMTYNFDPDKWLEDELFILHEKFRKGRLTQEELDTAASDLVEKHGEMWRRLDGTFQTGRSDD